MKELEIYLASWDPIGLIEAGAPNDEYHLEAFEIIRNYAPQMSGTKIATMVHEIFIKLTGVDYQGFREDCQRRTYEMKKILDANLESSGNQTSKIITVNDHKIVKLLGGVSRHLDVKNSLAINKIIKGQPINIGELMDLKLNLVSLKLNDHVADNNLNQAIEVVNGLVSENL